MKYLVTEIQSTPGGAVSTPTYAYDSDTIGSVDKALNAATAKYHTLLAGAAVSKVPIHTVLMYTDEGFYVRSEHFVHEQETQPES